MNQQDLFGKEPSLALNTRQYDKQTSRPQHTWFFALRPSLNDSQRIYALTENLLENNGIEGKRISPERLHITLELVGHDLDDHIVDMACRAAETIHLPALEARFDSMLTFSAPSGPAVLVGTEGLEEVRKLRNDLCCAMSNLGFTPSRAYIPHMTLCYDPRHRLSQIPIESIGFRTSEFALIKSHIGFSRHEVVQTWNLTSPSPDGCNRRSPVNSGN